MLNALVTVILPVLLVASVGVVLARTFTLDQDTVGKVSLYGLTPALAFSSLLHTSVSLSQGVGLAAAFLLATALSGVLALLVTPGMDTVTRRAVIACTTIGNNGNFGLPIALLALGRPGLDQAVVIFVLSLLVMFTAGPALLGSHPGITGSLRTIVRLPVSWAMAAAVTVRLSGLTLPSAILSAVEMLAPAAVPVILLSLGIQLAQSRSVRMTRTVVSAVLLRTIALPLITLGVGLALGLRGLPLQSLLLAQTMPTAVNTFMLAREYGADTATVASVVAVTTLISIPVLTVVISLLPTLG